MSRFFYFRKNIFNLHNKNNLIRPTIYSTIFFSLYSYFHFLYEYKWVTILYRYKFPKSYFTIKNTFVIEYYALIIFLFYLVSIHFINILSFSSEIVNHFFYYDYYYFCYPNFNNSCNFCSAYHNKVSNNRLFRVNCNRIRYSDSFRHIMQYAVLNGKRITNQA